MINVDVVAVIVARGGSKRIPNKNILPINGVSLLERKIDTLKQCPSISRVVVGSEDVTILELAKARGAEVVKRPDYYCDEARASANDMIGNMCSLISADIVVWAHCTNPLVSVDTYESAVNAFFEAEQEGYDSLLSVYELKEHLWDSNFQVLNYNPYAERHTLASELEPLYAQDGAIFIQRHKNMLKNSYFFGAKPKHFIMPVEEVFDINFPVEFKIAEILLSRCEDE